mmetsp:Transcript_2316/g.3056  ORF Transcript_2316/g.3056 Transcript_2316/m.3056 type:complete len:444 (+) Transcript_2316:147-1478(+)
MPPAKKDKMQEDFSERVAEYVPIQENLAKSGKLIEAVENLLSLEKQTRQGEDSVSTAKLAIAIIRLCYQQKDWKNLNNYLHVLAKRRGQLRTVVQDFVKEAMSYLDNMEKPQKLELLDTLRQITEGKMYVEIERARLTRILAKIKEDEGKIGEAADILQEIQVETFGQMDKVEKTEFILEQMRLCLDKKDYIKAQILSKKISKKALADKDLQDLKIRYYDLMIRYHSHDAKYLEICKCYQAMYDTPKVQENEAEWKKFLALTTIFACLAPFDNEQSDLINRVNEDKKLQQIPAYKNLLKTFLTKELIRWPKFQSIFSEDLNRYFSARPTEQNLWGDLQKRVVEHNVRVIAAYYSKITMKRLTELLDLDRDSVETFVSDLVINKSIFAKIDRPNGMVSFKKAQDPNEALNEWGHNINDLLSLLERTCHLIHRENMVHKVDDHMS